MRSRCSGLLVLGKAKTRWRAASWGWGHGYTPTATAAATHTVLLAFRPPFCQQLLLSITVRQRSDARVGLPFRGAFFRLNAASWHAVALHQPSVPLVLCGDTGLGTGTQLISHGTLRLSTSFWVVILTLVAVSALLSWSKETEALSFSKYTEAPNQTLCNISKTLSPPHTYIHNVRSQICMC